MKLSRTLSYAVKCVALLAESPPGQPVPCRELAAKGEMPERFLLQILRGLVNHGILVSTRGVEGGYALDRPASDVTLLEVFEAIDGEVAFRLEDCEPLSAQLQSVMNNLDHDLRARLARIRLSEMASRDEPVPAPPPAVNDMEDADLSASTPEYVV